jgi:hypothetical protein
MNCEGTRRGEEVLDAILADLDEGRIRKRIDEPIEAVLRGFTERLDGCTEPPAAPAVFSQFVQCTYREGLRAPWKVADPDAMTLMLLENHYRGLQSEGYFAAVLDVTTSEMGGMALVLAQLTEIIRTKERQEYVQAVFTRRIDPSDWRLRCEIVESLLERYRPLLPPLLLDCAPWQLVDEIPALVLAIVGSGVPVEGLTVSRRRKTGD